jgi:trehalose-6-phosphatase
MTTDTTDTTDTTTANKGGVNNGYPYLTKREIKSRLETDADFRVDCLLVMHERQTTEEIESKGTTAKNKRGWMSSHAHKGTTIALAVIAGDDLSDEQEAWVEASVPRYTKQLASHFRTVARDDNPDLAEKAAIFGV